MHILVINCGSSSLKTSIIDHLCAETVASARVERIGEAEPRFRIGDEPFRPCNASDHRAALELVLAELMANEVTIAAVGHRVVHGGEEFVHPTEIDDDVEGVIERLIDLAPLHNPANLAGIRAARKLLPDVPQVAVFDTAFHATLPRRAREYALPFELAQKQIAR